ncbi:aminopeptidase [Oceanobacillus neutriphilus]|uniref:Aminopeptidase n=1 Tax=Oceanobacillus neutriphilus TaxID=531815 RepID=A0ABQ2P328_9BACI|nr:aminopeptidase [Oceanobacillus neutriphilus]GGP16949.1 hypothetical protein GCM10011346_50950 [Oceanobacillus neutriphilus]
MSKEKYHLVSTEQLEKYAELAVRMGINVQKNQLVIIHSDIENAAFARQIQKAAYDAGASNVVVDWADEQSAKEFYLHAADEAIDHFPDWQAARFKEWDDAGAAYIHIISENPDVFKAVPPERMSRFQKASRTKLKAHNAKIRSHEIRWCLLVVPSFVWATKVFPHLNKEKALQSLWQSILRGARADGEEPIKDWEDHDKNFELRKKILNDSQFETLYFKNNRGTDLSIGMPRNHLYVGGGVIDKKGIPNLLLYILKYLILHFQTCINPEFFILNP